MRFHWLPYDASFETLVESWFDEETRRLTGCDDGWAEFYSYWMHEEGVRLGKNFWTILALEQKTPKAVFVIAETNGLFTFSECVVEPQSRGKGIGKAALTELLENAQTILGRTISEALAVIFPDNPASQSIFQYTGFRYAAAHADGDALYFVYADPMPCYCGHDCARCITRLASRLDMDFLRRQSVSFYKENFKRTIGTGDIHCRGGRSDDVFRECRTCPFAACCRGKGIDSCAQCRTPCDTYLEYKRKFVNRCHQI